jgi:hypothetical protein
MKADNGACSMQYLTARITKRTTLQRDRVESPSYANSVCHEVIADNACMWTVGMDAGRLGPGEARGRRWLERGRQCRMRQVRACDQSLLRRCSRNGIGCEKTARGGVAGKESQVSGTGGRRLLRWKWLVHSLRARAPRHHGGLRNVTAGSAKPDPLKPPSTARITAERPLQARNSVRSAYHVEIHDV